MKLHEAFAIFQSFSVPKKGDYLTAPADPSIPDSPQVEWQHAEAAYGQAAKIIYDELQKGTERIKGRYTTFRSSPDLLDDLVHDCFLNLNQRDIQTVASSEAEARNYLIRSLMNKALDMLRRLQRERERIIYPDDETADLAEAGPDFAAALSEDNQSIELREALRDSAIFSDSLAFDQYEETTYLFLLEKVLPLSSGRSPLKKNRQALKQMRQITTGELTFDELVERELSPDCEDPKKMRQRIRNRIHQNHKTTRDRLKGWLKEQQYSELDSASAQDSLQLTEFDLLVLSRAIDSLRSRRKRQASPQYS